MKRTASGAVALLCICSLTLSALLFAMAAPETVQPPDLTPPDGELPDEEPPLLDLLDRFGWSLLDWLLGDAEPGEPGEPPDPEPGGEWPFGDGLPSGELPDWTLPTLDSFDSFDWLPFIEGAELPEWDGPGTHETERYDVLVSDDPIPGDTVTVTVRHDGDPVEGVDVFFNREPIGTTDRHGQVEGEVPYDETLVIYLHHEEADDGIEDDASANSLQPTLTLADASVSPRTEWGPSRSATTDLTAGVGATADGSDLIESSRSAAATASPTQPVDPLAAASPTQVADPLVAASPTRSTDPLANATGNRTHDLDTSVDATVDGEYREGETVVVSATIQGVPVREADIRVNGVSVADTGDDGRAEVPLPYEETATIELERDAARWDTTLDLKPALNLTVEGRSIAGTDVDVIATRHGDPVEEATIAVDGEHQATTDADGTATVSLPLRNHATVVAERDDARGDLTLDWLLAWYGAGLLIVSVLAVAALGVRASDASARATVASGARRLARLGRSATRTVLRIARWLAGSIRRAADAIVRAIPRVREWIWRSGDLALSALVRLVVRLSGVFDRVARVFDRIVWAVRHPIVALRWLLATIFALPRRLVARIQGAGDEPRSTTTADPTPLAASENQPRAVVLDAWRSFVALVPVDRWRTRTPAELERLAIDAGLPAEPTRRLTEAFRAVRYGDRPAEPYVDRVRSAIDALRGGERR